MTSRERLRAVFNHKIPDRVPIWLLFPYEREPIAADVYSEESYQEVVRCVLENTDFIERNTLNVEFLGAKPGSSVVDFVFHHPAVHKSSEFTEKGQPYLTDLNDLSMIMGLPYEVPEVDLAPFRDRAERLGDRGLHGILIIDPISVFHDLCSETDFLIWSFTETVRVRRFLDVVIQRMTAIYEQFLEAGVGEVFFLSGPEYLTPPLGTLPIFRELVTAYDRDIVKLVRSYGKRTILHCHGRLRDVLEEMAEIGPEALQPVEPPPSGDCTLAEARRALGEEMVLIGNIEYGDLVSRTVEEIEELVAKAIAEGGPRDFVLGPSCSPYEDKISQKTAENYIAMITAGLKYGKIGSSDRDDRYESDIRYNKT
jgi:hypothetical protein